MTESMITAFITSAGAVLSGIVGIVIVQLSRLNGRLRRLEHRDRLSWLYIRRLIDHAYRHNAVPLPEPPDGWLENDE